MKTLLQEMMTWMRRKTASVQWRLHTKPRDLRSELKAQSTEDYWRRREKSWSRRFRFVSYRYRLRSLTASTRANVGIFRGAILSLLRSFASGGLLFGAVLAIEVCLAWLFVPNLVPSGTGTPPLSSFPPLAVQVSASLLGFYLASVSIVLGTSYHDVSAEVRALILGRSQVKFYLQSIGMAIGAGLTLVLLKSMGVSYGYLTVVAYALLVAFGGWAFVQLAFGAFNLFNPITLSREPLRVLFHAISKFDSKGLMGDEAVLQTTAREANRALRILAELVQLTSNRASVDRSGLADMVGNLLMLAQFYGQRKHLLAPTVGWFLPEPVYPNWIEASHSETSIALKTSTPLQPRLEPSGNWLERRSADLASAALAACVVANDRDSALRITNQVAETSHILAKSYRIDDAIALSAIVRDRCWSIEVANPAAVAAAAAPPLFLANLLLGWREAIIDWPDEIRAVVNDTKWDRKTTKTVQVRGL